MSDEVIRDSLDGAGEVLQLIRKGRAARIAELADAMGLARSTVALRVDRLIQRGLVTTTPGGSAAGRGRRAAVLRFNPRAGVVLAAHLGMTGARLVVTDLAGTILARKPVEFSIAAGPEDVLGRVERAFSELLLEAGEARDRVVGIGIGVPGEVELSTARQPDHPQVRSWDDFPIKEHLSAAFGVRTLVDQDVYLMAQAEQRFGWPETEVFLCVKVGTVIACGVVVNGRVVRGAQSMSGEIGHTRVGGKDIPCWCGNVGCLDAVAGGGALAAVLTARGLPCSSAKDVSRLAVAGVPEAVQLVRAAGRDIGEILSGAINLLNPGVIGFWGYLAEAEEPLFAGLHETIYQRSLPSATRNLKLARTRLGDDTGTIGAAMMVIDEVLSEDAIDGTSVWPAAAAAST